MRLETRKLAKGGVCSARSMLEELTILILPRHAFSARAPPATRSRLIIAHAKYKFNCKLLDVVFNDVLTLPNVYTNHARKVHWKSFLSFRLLFDSWF